MGENEISLDAHNSFFGFSFRGLKSMVLEMERTEDGEKWENGEAIAAGDDDRHLSFLRYLLRALPVSQTRNYFLLNSPFLTFPFLQQRAFQKAWRSTLRCKESIS